MPKLASIRLFAAVALLAAATSAILAVGLVSPVAASTAGWSSATVIDQAFEGPTSISCPTATFCVVADGSGNVLYYNGGTWSLPWSIDGTNDLYSVSCPTASFCVAVDGNGNALTYNSGTWSLPDDIDGTNDLYSVSCPTASFCAAVDGNGNALTYNSGTWSLPDDIDGTNALYSVSCPTASFCAAVDGYGNAFTYNGNSWTSPKSVDPVKETLTSVSCATASFCVAVDYGGDALIYNGSSWSSPHHVDAYGDTLRSVSCPTAGFCAAVGGPIIFSLNNGGHAVIYRSGSWSAPDSIDLEQVLSSVSCATAGFCVAVDYGGDAFTYSSPATSKTTITSVTSKPVVGQPVSVGVEVTGPSTASGSPTPSGQAIVSDGTRGCEAALRGSNGTARGTCSITIQAADKYSLTAAYPGDAHFGSSATSASTSLRVAKAASKTTLGLSAAKITYGDEKTEHLSVTVSPQYPGTTPSGTVKVTQSSSTLCEIALSFGKGSCTLSAKKFTTGTYHLVANYGGSANFVVSTSAEETLTVVK
jgi:hypothetical protein